MFEINQHIMNILQLLYPVSYAQTDIFRMQCILNCYKVFLTIFQEL